MTEHFRIKHDGKEAKENTEAGIRMQASFGGELKKWFEIIDSSAKEVDEENESAWEAVKVLLAKKKRKARASRGGGRKMCACLADSSRAHAGMF